MTDLEVLDQALSTTADPLVPLRAALKAGDTALVARHHAGEEVTTLVRGRAQLVDGLVVRAFQHCLGDISGLALVAVGGYGRGELHPYSDIDLMLVTADAVSAADQERIGVLWMFLWDFGLPVSHSVRSLEDSAREAAGDITVITNLMEARFLAGNEALYAGLLTVIVPERLWPDRAFFAAKLKEQQARHLKFHDTAYNLEPNIKEGPGGLRDIQMILWVTQRHFGAASLAELVEHGFLTAPEHAELVACCAFLWQVRFTLHLLAGRPEERLLFDHQRALAAALGYRDEPHVLAVEQFMQRYYRNALAVTRLNEMLLQLFEEAILYAGDPVEPHIVNRRFQVRHGYLETRTADVFKHYPSALLELFLLLAQHPQWRGLSAHTVRLVRDHCHLIDDKYRADLGARSLFMEILRQPRGVTRALRRMHRYGVLAAYIPAFAHVVGRMQYDLFHVYTVDEHTLFLVRNLRRFAVPAFAGEFPLCSEIMQQLPKPELLYLAGLFHDIAKGRGGDHSELGAADAERFCLDHGLSRYDARLVAWLVRHHLIMSMTAQRQDLSDPEIINAFARRVGDQTHLNYLYLLTVADIRATNPVLWNSWKGALLSELYSLTKRALRRGFEHPIDKEERLAEIRVEALAMLNEQGQLDEARIARAWEDFSEDYFLRYSPHEIAWHTYAIAACVPADLPLVLVCPESARGGTEVFLYARAQDHLFALTTTVLDQIGLTIVDARLTSSRAGYTLDTYQVLEQQGIPIHQGLRCQEIEQALRAALAQGETAARPVRRHVARQLKHFHTPTEVNFSADQDHQRTALELITADRPGLLARVAHAFQECGIRLTNAKIATLGARAEDVFFITDSNNRPLQDQAHLDALRTALVRHLDAA